MALSSPLVFTVPAPSCEKVPDVLIEGHASHPRLSKEEEDLVSCMDKWQEDFDVDNVLKQRTTLQNHALQNKRNQKSNFFVAFGSVGFFCLAGLLGYALNVPFVIHLVLFVGVIFSIARSLVKEERANKESKNIHEVLKGLEKPSLKQKEELLSQMFHLSQNRHIHPDTKNVLVKCFHLLDDEKGTARFWKIMSTNIRNVEKLLEKKNMLEKMIMPGTTHLS